MDFISAQITAIRAVCTQVVEITTLKTGSLESMSGETEFFELPTEVMNFVLDRVSHKGLISSTLKIYRLTIGIQEEYFILLGKTLESLRIVFPDKISSELNESICIKLKTSLARNGILEMFRRYRTRFAIILFLIVCVIYCHYSGNRFGGIGSIVIVGIITFLLSSVAVLGTWWLRGKRTEALAILAESTSATDV